MRSAFMEVAGLSRLPFARRAELPDFPGIYFVIAPCGAVVYVGRAVNVRRRWANHDLLRVVPYDRSGNTQSSIQQCQIAWMLTSALKDLPRLEHHYIQALSPHLNRRPVAAKSIVKGSRWRSELVDIGVSHRAAHQLVARGLSAGFQTFNETIEHLIDSPGPSRAADKPRPRPPAIYSL